MRYLIKPMESETEMNGKGYVHWKSWQESYYDLINPAYLNEKMTLEGCQQAAHRWPERTLVAKEGERVIGFVCYGAYHDRTMPQYGEIYALYVLQDYQKQGVGFALMNAALEKLQAYSHIALWVLKDNEKAIAFYQQYGFVFDGTEQELTFITPITECRMIYQRKTLS